MFIESGLIAMAMLAADAPPATGAAATPLPSSSFQLKVITIEGLGWRTTAFPRLVPVARRGTSTVWTADKALAKSLETACDKDETATATASVSGESSQGNASQIYFIAHANRHADGPINQATAVAYTPEVASFDEGTKATVNGRKLDQGVLATVSLEDHHLEALYSISLGESLKPAPGDIVKSANDGAKGIATNVQIPEVSHASVSGEWLIPNDGVILISLGIHTVADAKGKAVVRERLAILEVQTPSPMPAQTIAPDQQAWRNPLTDAQRASLYPRGLTPADDWCDEPYPEAVSRSIPPVPVASLVMPKMPARSLPEAVDPQGKVVELPPLPEGYASADLDRIKPAPNQPSPQAPGGVRVDPELARTSFVPVAEAAHVPTLKNGVPVDLLPYSCLVRKLEAAGIFDQFELDLVMDVDSHRLTIEIKKAPAKCDDKDCKADVAEAEQLMNGPARPVIVPPSPTAPPNFSAHPVTDGKLPTADLVVVGESQFFPSIEEAALMHPRLGAQVANRIDFLRDKVTASAAVAGFDVAFVSTSSPDTMTVTFKNAGTCEAACDARAKKSPNSPARPHCEHAADCDDQVTSKAPKFGGPTGAEAGFVKFLETLQAIEPELSPLGEVVAEKALLTVCGAMNKMGFPIHVVVDDEKDAPKPAKPVEAPAVIGVSPVPMSVAKGLEILEQLGVSVDVDIVADSPAGRLLGKLNSAVVPAKFVESPDEGFTIYRAQAKECVCEAIRELAKLGSDPGKDFLGSSPALEQLVEILVDKMTEDAKPAEALKREAAPSAGGGLVKLMKAVVGSGFKVEIKVESNDDRDLDKLVKELPPAKYMTDDVQYFAPVVPKVDNSTRKAASEAPKTIKAPAEPDGMSGPEANRRAMAKLIEATMAMGQGVEMKFNPTDNPAFCKLLESLHPGLKTAGAEFDFDIVDGPKVDTTPASLGLNFEVKNPDGIGVFDAKMNLTSVLQVPGKTETVILPIAGNLALEVKATVIPRAVQAKPAPAKP